ncbi:MAG: TPM domain-containing protein [Burkholderiales bacterium]|nr:TPM domain-containing protein [Burkholderiales bacterium]
MPLPVAAWLRRFCLGLVVWLASALSVLSAASAQEGLAPIPPLGARVTDTVNLLPAAERSSLEARLGSFEQKTGGQLAILIVATTQPETIEQYALRVAETWKIGQAQRDNGVVIVLATQDRKVRIEVGRGWEGALPDVEAKRIIREVMAPFFKQNQFAQGLSAAVDKIELAVAREAGPGDPAWQPAPSAGGEDLWSDVLPIAAGVFLAATFLLPALVVGVLSGVAAFFLTGALGTAAVVGFFAFVIAGILRGIFGSFNRPPLGGRRIYRDSGGIGPWISSGGGSWGGGDFGGGWSGGGGEFGGGGASGDW